MHYEIASVASLPRNDIVTQSPGGEEINSVRSGWAMPYQFDSMRLH
jgi:hypothetical protein